MGRRRAPEQSGPLLADPDRAGAYVVRLGGADQSYVDPADPTHLEFDYVQRIAAVVDACYPPPERIRVVHLGGAGLTLPRWVAATRPTSAQVVCEPDAELVEHVREHLPLPPRSGIKVRTVDARAGLAQLADDYADLVILDAFDGGRVPADVTTRECLADVTRVLAPGGVLVANLIDTAPFAYGKRVAATVRETFGHALLGAEPAIWKGRRMGNLILAASARELPVAALARAGAGGAFPWRLEADDALWRWSAGAPALSDASAQESPKIQGVHLAL